MIGIELGEMDEDKRAASLMSVDPSPSSLVGNLPCFLIPWKSEGELRILSGMSERERSLKWQKGALKSVRERSSNR